MSYYILLVFYLGSGAAYMEQQWVAYPTERACQFDATMIAGEKLRALEDKPHGAKIRPGGVFIKTYCPLLSSGLAAAKK